MNTVPLDRVADVVTAFANPDNYAENRRMHIAAVAETVAWAFWAPVLDNAPESSVAWSLWSSVDGDTAPTGSLLEEVQETVRDRLIPEMTQRFADDLNAMLTKIEQGEVPI